MRQLITQLNDREHLVGLETAHVSSSRPARNYCKWYTVKAPVGDILRLSTLTDTKIGFLTPKSYD